MTIQNALAAQPGPYSLPGHVADGDASHESCDLTMRPGDRVKRYVICNEPSVFALFGHSFGWHPPASNDPTLPFAAIHHVNLAHAATADALRSGAAEASIGAIRTGLSRRGRQTRSSPPRATPAASVCSTSTTPSGGEFPRHRPPGTGA